MLSILIRLTDLHRDRRAVTALEYGLIAAVVVAVGLAGFSIIGDSLALKVTAVQEALT